ncbi:taurine catabolism dioxygenase [Macrolepiota fuliginosa MF-IS2]|uniref:Taurine catabolism dioxygenase n=1 Tax=Macrolepiota fuliginosa MF-IS2 TaxID=1400762 RepID=A0A9P5X9S3_9AGAR|nr:taurine catabolism dioxygenase [Macrolepiota fuliginosa MF-IS2]
MTTTVAPSVAPSFLGSLSQYESYDATPVIGTVFSNKSTQLSQLLEAPNADELLHDLAVLVSHRGVVFFKDQDITVEQQKRLGQKLGELTGKPETSKLHKHPVSEDVPELGLEISVISSKGGIANTGHQTKTRASRGWHSDITFEKVPSDYAVYFSFVYSLVGRVGGDTLWASGYEAYDRLSPAYQKFLEGLTATHDGKFFYEYAKRTGKKVNLERGAPENIGDDLTAVHPVIRTNPVTGFKTLFVNKGFTKKINELTPDESDDVLEYLTRHFADNHDLQVRYRWETNDVAIWDNRVTVHTATHDYSESREGNRVVSLGEKPYFDPNSKSRREALGSSSGDEPRPNHNSNQHRETVAALPPGAITAPLIRFDAL